MDIYCPICAEPWEVESLHDVAEERGVPFATVRREFFDQGCSVAFAPWGIGDCVRPSDDAGIMRATVVGVLAELLGDDIDGIAADMEDFEQMGWL